MQITKDERVISTKGIGWKIILSRINLIRFLAIIILTICIFILLIGRSKMDLIESINEKLHLPFNSQTIRNQNDFDVVLSYYGEDVKYVGRYIRYLRDIFIRRNFKHRIFLYNKNPNGNNTYLKEVLKVDFVILLKNLGRESATYLYHIIENYDKLASHILFSQAGVEGMNDTGLHDWFSNRLEKQFNSSVGYMPLVINDFISAHDCGNHPSAQFPRLADLWGILQQTLCPLGRQAVAFRGQFLVSAKRIRARSIRIYKYLHELVTANSSHWIHSDPRSPRTGSSPENPIFGHTVERLWTMLFNCTDPDLHDRCVRNDCACLD